MKNSRDIPETNSQVCFIKGCLLVWTIISNSKKMSENILFFQSHSKHHGYLFVRLSDCNDGSHVSVNAHSAGFQWSFNEAEIFDSYKLGCPRAQ